MASTLRSESFAENQDGNAALTGTMEVLGKGVSANRARVALFDFDGTLSLIRTGWVDVMVPMMVEILAELKTRESEEELRALVDDFVARPTGEQTIYQMIELTHQVEKGVADRCRLSNTRACITIG